MDSNMSVNLHGTFTSEKISKVRWRPDSFDCSHSFLTGSWDNNENHLKLWSFQTNVEDSDIYPFVLKNYSFEADVTEIKFITEDSFVVSSSRGSLYYFNIAVKPNGSVHLVEKKSWKKIHKFKNDDDSSCTSFSTYDNDIATAGEDGTINLLNLQRIDIIRSITDADSCSFNCVTFLKHNEIMTGNLRGQMKIWDLRVNDGNRPSSNFMLSGEQVAATCFAYHPTQRHLVIAGDEEGSVTVWDLRQNTFPVNLLSAHSDSIAEIQFHPDQPDQLFSCSSSGELWHWVTNKPSTLLSSTILNYDADNNPWFSAENVKNKFSVYPLMPKFYKAVNSLDLNRNQLLCGCDNEAIYLINNLNIYN